MDQRTSRARSQVEVIGGSAVQPEVETRRMASRIGIVDLVRGLAVAFMALDHTRDYFTNVHFAPEDIDKTWPLLFLVRWVTHFCAPAFFLLMGLGAFLYGQKISVSELRRFLVTRGLWLIFVEFTIVGFAWTFVPGWGMFGVIWCLGMSLLLLACVIDLPVQILLVVAVVLIAGHDLFDRVDPDTLPHLRSLYIVLHSAGMASIWGHPIRVLFPLVPWCAVTMLGYGLGPMFRREQTPRKRLLLITGIGSMVLFTILRLTNLYGNPDANWAFSTPGNFHIQDTVGNTLILFLDVEKYPPSLQYLLMTLGPIFVLLAFDLHRPPALLNRVFVTFGRTPFIFYILHLYLIHIVAVLIAIGTHQPWQWLVHGAFFLQRTPKGYGHNLAVVLPVWILVLAVLYPACKWYEQTKTERSWRWMKYV